MDEISTITSALNAQQSIFRANLGMEIVKKAAQSDQSFAQMLMENIKAGKVVVDDPIGGSINLYA